MIILDNYLRRRNKINFSVDINKHNREITFILVQLYYYVIITLLSIYYIIITIILLLFYYYLT